MSSSEEKTGVKLINIIIFIKIESNQHHFLKQKTGFKVCTFHQLVHSLSTKPAGNSFLESFD